MTHDLLLGLLFFIWGARGREEERAPSSPQPRTPPTPPALPAGTRPAPPPWPQALPEGLPTFPGPGWEYDEPPPVAVQQRAKALLSQLWAQGSGASKTELTGGRWITFQAATVASGKKGVVAWRLKKASTKPAPRAPGRVMTASAPVLPKTAPSSARAVPVSTPTRTPIPQRRPSPEEAERQSAAAREFSTARPANMTPSVADRGNVTASQLPDLKEGMGTKAKPNGDVFFAQGRLRFHGYKLEQDGVFGNATRMAVIELQKRAALAPRIDNEQLRARGFGAIKRATWEVLLQNRPLLSSPLVTA